MYVRVDWNIPLHAGMSMEESLKLTRSYPLLEQLRASGAITLLLTHRGRPRGRVASLSTKPLAALVSKHSGLSVQYLNTDLSSAKGRVRYERDLDQFLPGDVVLLENVRFQKGEETCAASLVKAYAEHADAFINDAFASSHRPHATVTGLARALPSFAGPALCAEVDALSTVVKNGKHHRPFVAVIGGAKLTTKLPLIRSLLTTADKVLVGGAMAHPFLAAKRIPIGTSYLEKGSTAPARALMNHKRLMLPVDVVLQGKRAARPRAVSIRTVGRTDTIMDIGPETMRVWAAEIRNAKMIVWNGPMGKAEESAYAHGSLLIGRAIAARSQGKAFGVAGGGDTLPVVAQTGMQEWFDFVSTGGGAMLEYLASRGRLPGLAVLQGKDKHRLSPLPLADHRHEKGISCAPDASIMKS